VEGLFVYTAAKFHLPVLIECEYGDVTSASLRNPDWPVQLFFHHVVE